MDLIGRAVRSAEHVLDATLPVRSVGHDIRGASELFLTNRGARVRAGTGHFLREHGRVGEGTLPVVMIPGLGSSPEDYALMKYHMRAAGFDFSVVNTRWRSTASVLSDAQIAARTASEAMERTGHDGFILGGYSRGGLGVEAMRVTQPEDFAAARGVFFLDSPINLDKAGAVDAPAGLRFLADIVMPLTSGGRELMTSDVPERALATRADDFVAAHAADPNFRVVSFQAYPDLIPHELSALPDLPGITENIRAVPARAGHILGAGPYSRFNEQFALTLANMPANDAFRGAHAVRPV